MMNLLQALVFFSLYCVANVRASGSITFVDLGLKDKSLSLQAKLAAQVCIGLFNRHDTSPVYGLMNDDDAFWLEAVKATSDPHPTDMEVFMRQCMNGETESAPVASGYIRYNATSQAEIVPIIITLAGVLDAVPLEDDDTAIGLTELVFDAITFFDGMSVADATAYVFDNYAHLTSTMAKMNPGFQDAQKHPFNPPLTGTPNIGLVDLIVKQRMFNFYLNLGCIPFTEHHALVMRMVEADTPWPKPIPVWGYDDTFPIAGDLYEAETDCNAAHNMGQVASSGVNNLSFFSRTPAVTSPLRQVAPSSYSSTSGGGSTPSTSTSDHDSATPTATTPSPTSFVYDPTKTYVSIIVGDGDNVAFVKGSRKTWMTSRSEKCGTFIGPDGATAGRSANHSASPSCFPLVWSLSPHLLDVAPGWFQWYYAQAAATGADYFVLPPSGHLYAYPGMMPADAQAAFVAATEEDARLMGTSATVAWEFAGTWSGAIKHYFPRYAVQNTVQGLFAVNVPFFVPIPEFGFGPWLKHYLILDDNVVLFRPREWRGTTCTNKGQCQTSAELAADISAHDPGTVTHLYVTSDGGASIDDIFELVGGLEEHVVVVDHETLIQAALARGE